MLLSVSLDLFHVDCLHGSDSLCETLKKMTSLTIDVTIALQFIRRITESRIVLTQHQVKEPQKHLACDVYSFEAAEPGCSLAKDSIHPIRGAPVLL